MKKDLTIYDVQVNCSRLSKEKIENLARIVKENGGKIWENKIALDKIICKYFRVNLNDNFGVFNFDKDLQSISYARFVELFDNKELEVGKWYKFSVNGNDFVKFIFSGNYGNFTQTGFDADNEWCDMELGLQKDDKCIPMTEQEVSTLLIAEAKKRLGEDWENAKIKVCVSGVNGLLNSGRFYVFYNIIGDRIWNKNGVIYEKGKWAELLVEELTQFTDQQMEAIKSMKTNVDIITIENPSQETKDMCMRLRKDKEEEKIRIREKINKPNHYKNASNYDVINITQDNGLNFSQGAICKYVIRAGKKLYPNMNELESYLADLKKAQDHINREIEFVEKQLGNEKA